jgi:hypothetical protein
VSSRTLECHRVHSGVSWRTLECHCEHWSVIAYPGVSSRTLWTVMAYTGVSWRTLECHRVHSGVSWLILWSVIAYSCITEQNVLPDFTASIWKRNGVHSHCCEELKAHITVIFSPLQPECHYHSSFPPSLQYLLSCYVTHINHPKLFMCVMCLRIKYRVIQEEMSLFREVILSVIVRKQVDMNMCLIVSGYRDRAVWIYRYKIVVNGNKEKLVTVNFILVII